MSGRRKKSVALADLPEPNDRQREAIDRAKEGRARRPGRAAYNEAPDKDGVLRLRGQHSDEDGHATLVAETFGTTSDGFIGASLLGLAQVTSKGGKPNMDAFNASLALVGAIEPRDEFEAALATQLAATHDVAMEMLSRTKNASTRDAMRDYGNLATKLQRTFAAQVKALSDWRRGGEQVVRHVHVYPGGQAVVADTFNAGGYQNGKTGGQIHEQGAISSPLLGQDQTGNGVPVSCHEGQEAVSAAWGEGNGSAER